ncbi:MAG: adenylate/guanylate cyclase domain-containing protein [Candidatus Nitrosocosmicus sp.]
MIKISQNDDSKDNTLKEKYNKIDKKEQQRQTIINLFESGIPSEIIALELDIELNEVDKVIQKINDVNKLETKNQVQKVVVSKHRNTFHLDALMDIKNIISNAQSNMWKALRTEPVFTFPFKETQELLSNNNDTKIKSIILHIDIVGSTNLSMTLPIERFSKIIQAFTQEITKIIRMYGGYVLKYIGDAIIGFFTINTDNLYLPCINSINCAKTMVKVIKQGFNPILNQYDYPEMGVRIGIDYGENVIVKYLLTTENTKNLSKNVRRKRRIKQVRNNINKTIYDILGYTISITTKMSAYAKVDHIIIGQLIYDILSKEEQSYFHMVETKPENWNYISDETGSIYKIYINRT